MNGTWDKAFDDLAERFKAGLEGYELGAACSLRLGGTEVLKLWGGTGDRSSGRRWQADSLCCVFSVTKIFAALAVLDAVADGSLALDVPVHAYWPALGANPWAAPSLRQLLAHQAGLIGCRTQLKPGDYYRQQPLLQRLAREEPWWAAGTAHGYHARTYGLLLDHLLQQATGESVAQRLTRRHGIGGRGCDFHLGLEAEDLKRCVTLHPPSATASELEALPKSTWPMLKAMADRHTATGAAFQNPRLPRRFMNEEAFRRAPLASSSGHGTASALTMLLEKCWNDLPTQLQRDASTVHSVGWDRVLLTDSSFGLGFMLASEHQPLGLGPTTIGHVGSGGAVLFALPEHTLYFAFVPNRMRPGVMHWGSTAEALMSWLRATFS